MVEYLFRALVKRKLRRCPSYRALTIGTVICGSGAGASDSWLKIGQCTFSLWEKKSTIKTKNKGLNVLLYQPSESLKDSLFYGFPDLAGILLPGEIRRQFGPEAKEEVEIIAHRTQTPRLMPHLATAWALTFASRFARVLLDDDAFLWKEFVSSCSLQALAAGLKACSTCEASYMKENRISGLKCDTDVFVTFEGDNAVMLQSSTFPGAPARQQTAGSGADLPLLEVPKSEASLQKLQTGTTDFLALNMDMVSNLAFLLKAVNFHKRVLQWGLVARIYYKAVTKKEDFFSAWNACLHHVTSLPLAHIHREQFSLAVRSCPGQEDQALLIEVLHVIWNQADVPGACLVSGT
ncbi:Acyl-Coenzyme A Oxidase-Like Protein [Manis pentadactyla]|nr:Acyl-Coenzyme A Oxidase-Like Protein [Manis pentadactyla]